MNNEDHINQLTAHLFRENTGKMLAVLSRMFGLHRIEWSMDIVQDSFEAALTKWKYTGIPENPSAWLMQVAKNKAVNSLKREGRTISILQNADTEISDNSIEQQFDELFLPGEITDSQLKLLFSCCHPLLSEQNQVIITLHILCGFGVPEISAALLMNDEAVKKAIARSKAVFRTTGDILQNPGTEQIPHRIKTVHTILYLIFNEGYKTTRGDQGISYDLCYESIRLAKLLTMGDANDVNETNALLALMFLTISRFPARLGNTDEWLTLEEQDRTKWDPIFINEGLMYLGQSGSAHVLSRYHLEAAIASIHCMAKSFEETNWQLIANIYGLLEKIEPSAIVKLNRLIAESFLSNNNSLEQLDELTSADDFKKHFLLNASRADIYRRLGNSEMAVHFYQQALAQATSNVDKRFLEKRIVQLKS